MNDDVTDDPGPIKVYIPDGDGPVVITLRDGTTMELTGNAAEIVILLVKNLESLNLDDPAPTSGNLQFEWTPEGLTMQLTKTYGPVPRRGGREAPDEERGVQLSPDEQAIVDAMLSGFRLTGKDDVSEEEPGDSGDNTTAAG